MTARGRRDRTRGQALVEFALVVPLFLLVVFGIIDGGRLIFINNSLSEATRDGARWGSVQNRSTDSTKRLAIAGETQSRMTGVPTPTVTVTCERGGATVSLCTTNDLLVVRSQAQVTLVTPIISQLMGAPTLSAKAKVVVNQ